MLIGFGLRLTVDVGAHTRRMYSTEPNAVDELWKRAFWSAKLSSSITHCIEGPMHRLFYIQDRFNATVLGRPVALQEDE
jgi:hypothetical protein